jgi:hypothetical protein
VATTFPALLLLPIWLSSGSPQQASVAADPLARWLWDAWPTRRVVTEPAPCLRPADLEQALALLGDRHRERLVVEEVGRSVAGRPLRLLKLGSGPRRVLLFSQMHGDEPSATPALLDLVDLLLGSSARPELAPILEELTLLVLPMLNPDGAELYQRRNLQGIDVNRDALSLATPEGRALQAVRDRYQPVLAFNLHDQDRRAVVGFTGRRASIAVLAVSGDEAQTLTPGRARAMRAAAAIVRTLAPWVPGGIARYDEDWNPRAFGDNLTAQGTPVVLLESGGPPPGGSLVDLTRLDFVALLSVLADLAENDLADHDPRSYVELPRTASGGWADVVVRGALVAQPPSRTPYRADLAFDLPRSDRTDASCTGAPEPLPGSRLVEVGDARFLGAGRSIDAGGRWLVPALRAAVAGWRARRWLDGAALDRLARHGVAVVSWRVPATRLAEAHSHARRLAAAGRARLEPATTLPASPAVVVSRAPGEPTRGATLGSLLARLGERPTLEDEPSAPPLRPGLDASFLVLVPPASGTSHDPLGASLEAAWIDGVEVAASDG